MLNISFEEPEIFPTPDGREWIINPLKRKELKKLTKFARMNKELQKYQKEGNIEAGNILMYGENEDDEEEDTLLKLTDEIIDLSIREVKTNKLFPEKYRRQITKAIELCVEVVKASSGKSKGSGNPLPQKSTKE